LNTYFAVFLIATLASLVITPLVRRFCERFNLLDFPRDLRRLHNQAIPRLGGLALYLSVALAFSLMPIVNSLFSQQLQPPPTDVFLLIMPATLVLIVGIYDDLRGTNAAVKFVALGLISLLFFALGGRIEALSIPFVGSVQLPFLLSLGLTLLWLVGIANAFNLIDGMDGLSAGAALFSTLVILVFSVAQGRPLMILVSLVLCGALAGFLRYNFNPASIFLGDSGALFIGFTLAALSVLGAQKATTAVAVVIPLFAFGLPVVDTSVTMMRRFISRTPVFQGDNEHIHHMLMARGFSQRQAALVLYGVCAAFGLLAMLFANTGTGVTGLVLFVLSVVMVIAVGHLRYHEVDELKAGVKRTVRDRRIRIANNVRVRRAARSVSKARDLPELFLAVAQMLEFGEFCCVNALIGQPGHAEANERALHGNGFGSKSVKELASPRQFELRSGRIFWSWHQPGIEPDSVTNSRALWCLSLPLGDEQTDLGWINFYRPYKSLPLLLDTNYLVDLFRLELTEAVKRILVSYQHSEKTFPLSMTAKAGKQFS